jgi:hypothetical protein
MTDAWENAKVLPITGVTKRWEGTLQPGGSSMTAEPGKGQRTVELWTAEMQARRAENDRLKVENERLEIALQETVARLRETALQETVARLRWMEAYFKEEDE